MIISWAVCLYLVSTTFSLSVGSITAALLECLTVVVCIVKARVDPGGLCNIPDFRSGQTAVRGGAWVYCPKLEESSRTDAATVSGDFACSR